MLKRFIRHINRDEKGITGLETAIILIAFVVVAAVFAYTALSAGLFSTQKSQEAVYSGLKEARSTMELKGSVVATAQSTGHSGTVKQLSFIVSNVLGGEAIDFTGPSANASSTGTAGSGSSNVVVISYTDENQRVEDLYWTVTKLGDADGDNMLEDNEKFKITIGASDNGTGAGNLIDALGTDLSTNVKFSVEVKAAAGATLSIERTTPAYIDTIVDLH